VRYVEIEAKKENTYERNMSRPQIVQCMVMMIAGKQESRCKLIRKERLGELYQREMRFSWYLVARVQWCGRRKDGYGEEQRLGMIGTLTSSAASCQCGRYWDILNGWEIREVGHCRHVTPEVEELHACHVCRSHVRIVGKEGCSSACLDSDFVSDADVMQASSASAKEVWKLIRTSAQC
jgi:hypothetical protein